jgi:hypothetical protein
LIGTAVTSVWFLLGCAGPPPPDGYQQSFHGESTTTIIYDDPSLPPSISSGLFDLFLYGSGDPDIFTTEYGGCDFVFRVGGVSSQGVVHLSPDELPILCSATTRDGSTIDIEWSMSSITWEPDKFDLYLNGHFTSRDAGRDDRTGSYTLVLDGY